MNKNMRTRRLRAVAISVAAHLVVLAALVFARLGDSPTLQPSPLIVAELVTALSPEVPAPTGIEALAPETPRQPDVPVAPEPRVEPAPTPAVTPAPAASEPKAETPAEQPPKPADFTPPTEPVLNAETDVGAASDASVADANAADAAPPADEPPTETRADEVLRKRLASWTGQFTADKPEPTVTWRDAGQQYTAVLRRMPASDEMGMERLAVAVTTERDGESFATELTMTRLAFSSFGQFVDRWDPEVRIHDDVVEGRFHSNSAIGVLRDRGIQPTFKGKVTIADGEIDTGDTGFVSKRKLFPAGYEMNVRRVVLPKRGATVGADSLPAERVQRFDADADIVFHWDGSFVWKAHESAAAGERRELGEEPFYLVAAQKVTLHVSGVVNGKVLVYSPDTIVIVDDLTYADDPRKPGASDYLGLVAENTVEIAEPEVTGVGDLTVHASIYARHRFTVRDYLSRKSGLLAIVGSVTAGTLSATEPRYATSIAYDDRLADVRAPGFPLSDRYELDEWNGEWRPIEE